MANGFAARSPLHVPPLHVAIVPDGNGRWAVARGLPRSEGHRAGVEAVRRVVRAAPELGIGVLTIHALSCDNRQRPEPEVLSILACVRTFLELETPACVRDGVRVTVLGSRERLPAEVGHAIEVAERATAGGTRLHLRLAVDYSARRSILAAFLGALVAPGGPACFESDVDLLIRTGGEQRLGDFLLWECAYAELLFVATPWPEFGERDLAAAVAEFARRERRFGGLSGSRVGDATAPDAATSPALPVSPPSPPTLVSP